MWTGLLLENRRHLPFFRSFGAFANPVGVTSLRSVHLRRQQSQTGANIWSRARSSPRSSSYLHRRVRTSPALSGRRRGAHCTGEVGIGLSDPVGVSWVVVAEESLFWATSIPRRAKSPPWDFRAPE